MKKSIVIMMATYNGEKYIDEQLKSIYEQIGDFDIKLMVRDDNSTDETLKIIKFWENKLSIELIEDEDSLGAAKSFWKLLEMAPEADYYAFVDQDDRWHKNKLSVAIETLEKEKGIALWCSDCRLIDSEGNVLQDKMHEITPNLSIESQMVCGEIQGCAMVFNKLARNSVLEKQIKVMPMHDIVFLLNVVASGKVIYEDTPFFDYRMHANNVVAKEGKSFLKKVKSTYNLWISHKHEVSSFAADFLELNKDSLSQRQREYLEKLSTCRNNILSRLWLITSVQTVSANRRGLRSFKIRVLLGLI